MRISPKQYAILLYEMTREAKKGELKEQIRQFVEMLMRGRALSALPRILELYRAYYNVQEGVVDVEVVSAREPTVKAKNEIEKLRWNSGRESASARTDVRYSVDNSVLGGARIRVGDWMVDDTLKARLNAVRGKMKYAR